MSSGRDETSENAPARSDGGERRIWADIDAAPAADLSIRIGNYEVKREIASGGMGVVYEAVQRDPRRVVALKVMRGGGAARSASWLRRFKYEAQLLARLRHPNIAQIYEGGTHGEGAAAVPFFAMEYVPGARNIIEYARAYKLPLKRRIELFLDVCDAVHHAHTKGIIHRDLKPANILVDSDGRVKIIDFGVARAADSDLASAEAQTDVRTLVGTLQYMSPEQCDGDPNALDARSDVYSLGVLLYELLCGRVPYGFDKPGITEAARVICQQAPMPPRVANPSLRGDVETVLLKALQKERARRYASAAELARDLRNLLAGEPIGARRDSVAYVLRKHGERALVRHRIAAALLVILLTIVLVDALVRPAVNSWTPLGGWSENLMMRLAVPHAGDGRFEFVRVAAVTDQTDLPALAEEQKLGAFNLRDPKSMRLLHGRAMQRLAAARPRTVVWDLTFVGETDHDAEFIAGVRALNEAGADVIVGVPDWNWGPDEPPPLSRDIAKVVRYGGIGAGLSADATWRLDLFVQRGPDAPPLPSLSLAALASYRHPQTPTALKLHPREALTIEIEYLRPNPSAPQSNLVRQTSEAIRFSHFMFVHEPLPDDGLRAGDRVGQYLLHVPNAEAIDASSVPYEALFRESDERLRQRFGGKLVLLGDGRSVQQDHYGHPDGRTLWGGYAHATGIDAMLRSFSIRASLPGRYEWQRVFAAVAGALAVLVAGPSWWRRGVALACVVVTIAILCFAVCRWLHFFFDPLVLIAGAAIAFSLMLLAERIRLSHVR